MKKYTYYCQGREYVIEVTDEQYEMLREEDRKIYNSDKKYQRHTTCLCEGICEDYIDYSDEKKKQDFFERLVGETMLKLDDQSRIILQQIFFARMTQKDIAKKCGISQPAVHKRLNKAKESFAKQFLTLVKEKDSNNEYIDEEYLKELFEKFN